MIAKAQARYIRITPRKFRQIIPIVKGKNPETAISILMNVNKRASIYAIELLKSAIANAKRARQGIDVSTLYVSRMIADGGPMLKRFRAASMGRASMIKKRTSHITIELDEMPASGISTPSKHKGPEHLKSSRAAKRAVKTDAVAAKDKTKTKKARPATSAAE